MTSHLWPPPPQPYAPQTAGASASTALPVARADDTVARALTVLSVGPYDSIERLWLLDARGHLAGIVPTAHLLGASPERMLASLALPPPPGVEPEMFPERVALHALKHSLDAVPVLQDGRLLGVVGAAALLGILRREHIEDLHRLAGIHSESPDDEAIRALQEPPTRNALHRLPWLLVGLVGTFATGAVMTGFEDLLRRDIAVAFFVPGIVYLADAVGTQTESLAVRGLSRSHQSLFSLISREFGTGLLLGAILGAISLPAIALGWGDLRLALAVAISILVACASATSVGLLLPWALSALRQDPAFGSGPLATIIQDVASLVVYLLVVTWLRPA